MSQTLEERVKDLEKQVAELQTLLVATPRGKKDWTRSVGIFAEDDPHFDQAVRLGREWREAQTDENEIADS